MLLPLMSVSLALTVAVFTSVRLQEALHHKSFTFLGRISYGVYLLQFIVLLAITPAFVHLLNLAGLRTVGLVAPVTLVVSVGLVIGAAVLFYRWVEEPSMRLGRALAGAYERRTNPSPGGGAG